jgi:glucosyl-dolichyl phosphate glucuronosyltransferase
MTLHRPAHPGTGVAPHVSVVLCTYNRAALLAGAIEALVRQADDPPPYEVIVVDNNSTDATRDVVLRFAPGGIVRYEFEPQQGLSAARNRGIAAARADVIAFTDDDVRVAPNWIRAIAGVFAEHADVDFAGGQVEPEWEAPPPAWLARAGHAPLALVDYGSTPFRVGREGAVCLVGANLCVRRKAFERAGLFSTALQRVGNGIGSTEDHELELRLLANGGTGWYEPRMTVRALVPRGRLTKQYHRAWHTGHGRFYALMRDPAFEGTNPRTLLGVPTHVYRKAARELTGWLRSLLRRDAAETFRRELRVRFFLAFIWQRISGRAALKSAGTAAVRGAAAHAPASPGAAEAAR